MDLQHDNYTCSPATPRRIGDNGNPDHECQKPLAVILAGGLGTRLGALADGLPKPMVPVGGRPFIDYILHQLSRQGFQDVILLVGYRAKIIQDYCKEGDAFGLNIRYSIEQAPVGTGGAVKLATRLIDRKFLLLFGDLYRPIDYMAISNRHASSCLATYPYTNGLTTIGSPNIGLDLKGQYVEVYAKDRPDLFLTHVDAGFGFFEPSVVDLLPGGISNFESRVYPYLASRGLLEAEVVDRTFYDVGNPSDLEFTRSNLGLF